MTANIALSCIGVVFTALWLWWVYYSVKTLRKFEQTTKENGEEILIVREKVWRKSMARLLRRDEDDDVNGIKRIATGGLVDLIEMESRRSVNRRESENGRRSRHRHRHHSSRGPGGRETLVMSPGLGLQPSTPRPSHESSAISRDSDPDDDGRPRSRASSVSQRAPPSLAPDFARRDTNEILQSLPARRGDMPPPPYIGQPLSSEGEGTSNTQTYTLSSSGEGTNTSSGESPGSHQALLAAAASSPPRPLPLAPPQVDRVLERKMDEMASASGTYTGGTMDAFTATRLGLGPAAFGSGSGSGAGAGEHKMESLVDRKLDSFQEQRPPSVTAGPSASASASGPRSETMEQLVDRKISDHHGWPAAAGATAGQGTGPSSYAAEITTSPTHMHPLSHPHGPEDITSTWPGSNPPPQFNSLPFPSGYGGRGKGKAAEAGFSLDEQQPGSSASPVSGAPEMSLEEMIERKMAAMRNQNRTRPQPDSPQSGEGDSDKSRPTTRPRTKSGAKGKGKGRARAGSDPGPKLAKHDETDEDESGEG